MKKVRKEQKTIMNLGKVIAISCVVILSIILGLCIYDYINTTNRIKEVKTYNIKSCIDSNVFTLGIGGISTGYLESLDYYFYMQKDKGFILTSLSVKNVEIVTSDTVEPYIEGHFNTNGDIITSLDVFLNADYKKEYCKYTLYIPSNYELQDFNTLKIGDN